MEKVNVAQCFEKFEDLFSPKIVGDLNGQQIMVVPIGHVKLMLFEPAGIAHTGKVKSEITKKKFERLEDI